MLENELELGFEFGNAATLSSVLFEPTAMRIRMAQSV